MLPKPFSASLFALILLPSMTLAKDAIETWPGPLSDDNFFNLVTCGAEPDKTCREAISTWPKGKAKDLTVSLICKGASKQTCASASVALKAAIREINAVGTALRLRKTNKKAAVTIFATKINEGEKIQGINASVNGVAIEAAHVVINYDDANRITDSTIVLGAAIEPQELLPITLEELTQSLGPIHDIRNSYYDTRSVLSEDSNTQTKLGKQDKMVLRRLYPK